jgi:hypothetical protein
MTGDGTVTNVPNHVPRETKEKADTKVDDKPQKVDVDASKTPENKANGTVDTKVASQAKAEVLEEAGFEPGDKVPAELKEKIQKRINAKHRAMVEAQEAADEAERFAETQYNERVLAEKRAEAAEKRASELEGKKSAPKEAEFVKPTADDKNDDGSFKYRDASGNLDWDKYTDAKAEYSAELKQREYLAKQKEATDAQERAAAEDRIKASVQRARDAHPDFDQVMKSVPPDADQVPQWVLNYLGESNESGLVAYHLASNPEEAKRISKLKPILGLAELGKLEDKLTTKTPPKVEDQKVPVVPQRGGAPPPITPLDSGSASVNTDPAKMSYKELRAYERARRKH